LEEIEHAFVPVISQRLKLPGIALFPIQSARELFDFIWILVERFMRKGQCF
jgi:hypothetical protein